MNIEKASMSKRVGWDNEEIFVPMFTNEEMEKASTIAKTLSGLTIAEAKSLLERVALSLEKVVVVPSDYPSEAVAHIHLDTEAIAKLVADELNKEKH